MHNGVFFINLIVLAVICLLCGPVGLIISIIALKKTRSRGIPAPSKPVRPIPQAREVQPKLPQIPKPIPQQISKPTPRPTYIKPKTAGSFEQTIGTRWVLMAGIITVMVGVGFFLKFAYDNALIGPLGRVIISAVSGLVALIVGDVTRRRGYDLVAKGVTALGFAILYASVFSAYRFYNLIDSAPAFVLAILITAAAMLYAVSLDEICIAFISLLGGFLSPVIVSTGQNMPVPLFSYVLILGFGAIICAYWRKWRAINILAFVGTFLLYTGWFEKFYRSTMNSSTPMPEQMGIAIGALSVFFLVCLLLPLINELVRKTKAQTEDVLLIVANAAVTFYYLCTILYTRHRTELAFCATLLCAIHLVVMSATAKRVPFDINTRLALLAVGLFFLTIAIPLYLSMYALAIAWAAEAVILIIIGLRYKSIMPQIAAAIAFFLSFIQLLHNLPMHSAAFTVAVNPAFGSWCFAAAGLFISSLLYRHKAKTSEDMRAFVSQVFFAAAELLLMLAIALEWYWHCDYNIAHHEKEYFTKGLILTFSVFTLLTVIRPLCAKGWLCRVLAVILSAAGAICTLIGLTEMYHTKFTIFANGPFLICVIFVASLFAAAAILKRQHYEKQDIWAGCWVVASLLGIFALWVLLSEEIYLYFYWKARVTESLPKWRFLASMYISVMWAIYGALLMSIGFWRKITALRYIALGLFALLLAKVFILDTGSIKSVYRIAAFLATGLTLVGVSYLYQYLRKNNFFERMLAEKNDDQ